MSLIKIITPNFQYEDLRGRLVQLVRTGYCQVNIIESVAGATRGGHYHIQNREAFYVIGGKLKLTVWHLNVGTQKEEYEFSENAMFEIEPYTIHSFATVYKGNIIKNLIMDCQSYTKYRPNETTGGIFVSWRRKEELPTGA